MKNQHTSLKLVLILSVFAFVLNVQDSKASCETALDSMQFQSELDSLKSHDFDDNRKTQLLETLEKKCISSVQLKDALLLFSFEEDKINIAIAAYGNVSDPDNFSIVMEVFEFESSKKEVKTRITTNN